MNYEKHNDLSRAAKDWHTGDCRKVQHKLDGTIYEVWRIGFPKGEEPYLDVVGLHGTWGVTERVPLSQFDFLANTKSERDDPRT